MSQQSDNFVIHTHPANTHTHTPTLGFHVLWGRTLHRWNGLVQTAYFIP